MSETFSVFARVHGGNYTAWMRKGRGRDEEAITLFKEQGQPLVIAEMRNQVPFKTGFLRESVSGRETPKGFTVFASASYAKFVDEGTKPHMIRPVNGQALRWFGAFGNPIFARVVNHPGTKGVFFTRKTRDAVKTPIHDLLKRIWRQVHGIR